MSGSVACLVLDIQVVFGLHKHLEYVESFLVLGCQMERIVPLCIAVIDHDTCLSKHSHNVAVAAAGRDKESIQTMLVLLIDVDHLILKHKSYKVLTIHLTRKQSISLVSYTKGNYQIETVNYM